MLETSAKFISRSSYPFSLFKVGVRDEVTTFSEPPTWGVIYLTRCSPLLILLHSSYLRSVRSGGSHLPCGNYLATTLMLLLMRPTLSAADSRLSQWGDFISICRLKGQGLLISGLRIPRMVGDRGNTRWITNLRTVAYTR